MNWVEIQKKYPKCWIKLTNFVGAQHIDSFKYLSKLWRVELLDFFDENELNIAILPFFSKWIWKIRYEDMQFIDGDKKEETRLDAEKAAFLKAFEILECDLIV
ncbi:MAG: hypothetical protein JETCAE03_34770 [Ignavibacteriaceae bacterium]|jgi:hypothetical protein|nr:MAG: hypothetical protein JETCAE03_34770 [Ignavibacteriaceae bacterium]